MKKRFRYLAIKEATSNGAFGNYLSCPVTDKTRTLIISERLSFLRQQAKLSQRDVCDIIGVAVTTYSGYEKGKHEPSLETICRLASLYEISSDFILGVGFYDPYSNEMGQHYVDCKEYEDYNMSRLDQALVDVVLEQHQLETDLSGVGLPHDPEYYEDEYESE